MKKIILALVLSMTLVYPARAASLPTYFVSRVADCPTEDSAVFGQNNTCAPDVIWGVDYSGSPNPQCKPASTVANVPGVSGTSNTQFAPSLSGGYVMNCYYDISGSSYVYCNASTACLGKHRDTNCTANSWVASTCGSCSTNYLDCSGDNTCEVQVGVTAFPGKPNANYATCSTAQCTAGYMACNGETPTVNGCNYQAGITTCTIAGQPGIYDDTCTCIPSDQMHFIANTLASGGGAYLLYGKQLNPNGWLINLLNSATGASFNVNQNGKVSINSTSTINPNAEIDIQSGAASGSHWGIFNDRNDNSLKFWNTSTPGTKNALTILAGGNVGVGFDNPSVKLSLGSDFSDQKLLLYDNSVLKERYGFGVSNDYEMRMFYSALGHISFGEVALDGATWYPKMVLDKYGNLGIGTDTPASTNKLTVVGNTQLTGALLNSAGSAGTNGQLLQSTGSGFQWVSTSTLGFSGGGSGEPIIVPGTNSQYWRGDKTWQTLNTAIVPESGSNLYFTNARAINAASTTYLTIANAVATYEPKITVLSVAKGGTGTSTAPNGKLLMGNGTGYNFVSTSSLGIISSQWSNNGSNIFYSSGNVGIGIANPVAKLDINSVSATGTAVSGISATYFSGSLGNANNSAGVYGSDNSGYMTGVGVKGSSVFGYGVYGTSGSGNFGILGYANLNAGVYANGSVFGVYSDSNRNFFAGSVGIGTTTPDQKLTVAGSIRIVDGTQSVGKVLTSDANGVGSWTTITGWSTTTDNTNWDIRFAGAATSSATKTGLLTSADWNTFNNKASTSTVNQMIAASSTWTVNGNNISNSNSGNVGINTTTPSQKLDVVGFVNVDANFGYKQGGATILRVGSALFNLAVGEGALATNSTGFQNTANGYQALYSNTVGSVNTANGYQALYSNTLGNSNTANGHRALHNNTTGYGNTANGQSALFFNITGYNNTATGFDALSNNTTGSGNVALGYSAGKYETSSNNFYVDNQDRVSSTGDRANALLYGTFAPSSANQTLKINAKLTINDGTQANGRVFTSDANGVGSWQTLPVVASWSTTTDNTNWDIRFAGAATSSATKTGLLTSADWNTFNNKASTSTVNQMIAASSTWTVNGNNISNSNSGNVGIGIITPAAKFEVASSSNYSIRLLTGTNTSGYSLSVGVNDDGVNFINNSLSRGFNFKNNNGNTNLMSIDPSGNVGIGTTTPSQKLTIAGSIRIFDGTQGAGKVLTSDANGVGSWTTITGWSTTTDNTNWDTKFTSAPNASSSTRGLLTSADWNTFNNKQPTGNYLLSVTASAPLSGSGTAASPLIISKASSTANGYLISADWNNFNNKVSSQWTTTGSDIYYSGGKVGIGMTSPSAMLAVAGAARFSNGGYSIDIGTSTAPNMADTISFNVNSSAYIKSTNWISYNASGHQFYDSTGFVMGVNGGGVNMGSNAAGAKTLLNLSDLASSGPIISLRGATTNYRGLKIASQFLPDSEYWFVGASSSDFVLRRGGATNDIVDNNGNIGIGMTPGAYKLDVNGGAHVSSGLTVGGSATIGGSVSSVGGFNTATGIASIGGLQITPVDTSDVKMKTGAGNPVGWDISSSITDAFVMAGRIGSIVGNSTACETRCMSLSVAEHSAEVMCIKGIKSGGTVVPCSTAVANTGTCKCLVVYTHS